MYQEIRMERVLLLMACLISVQPDTDAVEIRIIQVPQVRFRDVEFYIVAEVALWKILNIRYCRDDAATRRRGD